jgi:hypothetical protein
MVGKGRDDLVFTGRHRGVYETPITADGLGRLTTEYRSDLPRCFGAKGNRTPDLLDANESTWAFIRVDLVDRVKNFQVRALTALAVQEGH